MRDVRSEIKNRHGFAAVWIVLAAGAAAVVVAGCGRDEPPKAQTDLFLWDTATGATRRYDPEQLVGSQVLAVTNFPPRKIAGFSSQVLVLGAIPAEGDVVLVRPDAAVDPGTRVL